MGEELALKISERFLDLLFPRRCVGCGVEGSWLCDVCGAELTANATLEEVEENVWALYPFENRIIRELLHTLKYNGVDEIAEVVVNMTKKWLPAERLRSFAGNATLVPVPTSRATRKQRGYNQAELVAAALGEWLGNPLDSSLLTKDRKTTSVGKSGAERRAAAKQLFSWQGGARDERPLLVIDDIYTTGSTVAACRSILEEHTAGPVKVLVVAREH